MVKKDTEQNAANTAELPEVQKTLERNLLSEFGEQIRVAEPLAWKEYGLSIEVEPHNSFAVFQQLRDAAPFLFNMLVDVSCVDWMDRKEPRFEVFYHLLSLTHHHRLCVKVFVPEEKPEVPSVRSLWPSANFMEREAWDMFGVVFTDHGDLRRILMYEEFQGHPLRKDYPVKGKQPRVQLRVPELRNTSDDMYREPLVSLPVRQRLK